MKTSIAISIAAIITALASFALNIATLLERRSPQHPTERDHEEAARWLQKYDRSLTD